jgi:hypothetical protein
MSVIGLVIALTGLALEGVAAAAMGSRALRRRLPVRSPIDLMGFGATLFIVGAIVFAVFR